MTSAQGHRSAFNSGLKRWNANKILIQTFYLFWLLDTNQKQISIFILYSVQTTTTTTTLSSPRFKTQSKNSFLASAQHRLRHASFMCFIVPLSTRTSLPQMVMLCCCCCLKHNLKLSRVDQRFHGVEESGAESSERQLEDVFSELFCSSKVSERLNNDR